MSMKPMNCPHHTRIYASQPRSYRNLPLRYLETTTDYRDEKTGELGGLNRVRALTQDDSHVFCRDDQIETEINNLLACANELYSTVGMDLRVRLSYRDDSDAYLGDKDLWASAQEQLKNAVIANKLEYFEQDGEAAFYGPKIDVQIWSTIGREFTLATNQVDFAQGRRFKLSFTNKDNQPETPLIIHRAPLGTHERFIGFLLEHFAGKFPLWLAPLQVKILPISDKSMEYAQTLLDSLKNADIRAEVDDRSEKIGKKIRDTELAKVPYMLVIGEKEMQEGKVAVRRQGKGDLGVKSIDEFISGVRKEIKERTPNP